jgi:hypothetical protein
MKAEAQVVLEPVHPLLLGDLDGFCSFMAALGD